MSEMSNLDSSIDIRHSMKFHTRLPGQAGWRYSQAAAPAADLFPGDVLGVGVLPPVSLLIRALLFVPMVLWAAAVSGHRPPSQ